MISLKGKIREKNTQGYIPGILYGDGVKNVSVEVVEKEFEASYREAGSSSVISLDVDDKKYEVLIHQIQKNPVSDEIIHIDFYRPSLTKKVEAEVTLVFTGEAPATKDLGGILVRELQEIKVKALVKDLPREIKVDLSSLVAFEDRILVKDLQITEGVELQQEPKAIVAYIEEPRVEEAIEDETTEAVEGEEQKEGEEVEGTPKEE